MKKQIEFNIDEELNNSSVQAEIKDYFPKLKRRTQKEIEELEAKVEKKIKNKKESKERKYDERNKLNDLTGSEWKFATKTVISKIYSTNMQHKLRSQHGGQKPPELCADLIKVFSKRGQKILDPLAGFRVIIMTQANSQVNTRVLELLPKFKIKKMNRWCAV